MALAAARDFYEGHDDDEPAAEGGTVVDIVVKFGRELLPVTACHSVHGCFPPIQACAHHCARWWTHHCITLQVPLVLEGGVAGLHWTLAKKTRVPASAQVT